MRARIARGARARGHAGAHGGEHARLEPHGRARAALARRPYEPVERSGKYQRVEFGRRRAHAIGEVGEARERARGKDAFAGRVREPGHAVQAYKDIAGGVSFALGEAVAGGHPLQDRVPC